MSDNVLQTLQKLVQDVIAPDVRELKVRLESLSNENETRFAAIEKQLASLSKENEAQYRGILAAIGESKAQADLAGLTAIAALRERIAVLEARAA